MSEESAPLVAERPLSSSLFYVLLGALVITTAITAALTLGKPSFEIYISEIAIIWALLLLLYFVFNRPFIVSASKTQKVGSWLKRWIVTTNHKDIGVLYIVTSLFFALVGGVLAELIRTQLMTPNNDVLTGVYYNEAVSLHGLIMILWFLSPFAFGFANYIVPLQIGARDLAFPRLNAMSYWLYAFSGVMLISAFFLPGGNINGGWTLYSPLTANQFMPGAGPTVGFLALIMLIASITASSVNFLTTIFSMRAPGVTLSKIPMFTWFIVFTVVQMMFAFPTLLAAGFMLAADRVAGTTYFSSILGGGPMLWDNMFWFFGHPEVYIVLLPSFGALAEIIPLFSGKKELYGKNAILLSTFAVVVPLSFLVWGHHEFTTVLPLTEKEVFMVATIAISLPFDIIVIDFIRTMAGGRIRLKAPMLFALGALFVFIIGGIAGVFLASVPLDQEFRGTYFVVAHFHYVMVGASVFGLFAALYYWFPRMARKMYNETLARIHFITSLIFFNVLYFPMFLLYEMPRRIFTYEVPAWTLPNTVSTIGAYLFGAAQFILVANLIYSLARGKPAPLNPWGAETREWQPEEEEEEEEEEEFVFESVGTLGVGQAPVVGSAGPKTRALKTKQAQVVGGYETNLITLHHISDKPFIISLGLTLTLIGFPILSWNALGPSLFGLGLAVTIWGLLGLASESLHEKFKMPESLKTERWPFIGIRRLKLGIWLLLFTEVALFGSVLTADTYVRVFTPSWPLPGTLHSVTIGTINTIILMTSSFTGFLALNSIRKGDQRGMLTWLAVTFALGASFIGVKGFEWYDLLSRGLGPATSNALSAYFFTTGLHLAHVSGGLGSLIYLIKKGLNGGFTKQKHEAVEAWGIYWSFVDAVWVFIFIFFYLT